MYDSMQCSFMRIKKPPRRVNCDVCGPNASITSMEKSAETTKTARGPSCTHSYSPTSQLDESHEISTAEYFQVRERNEPHILLDVRVPEQVDLCALSGSVNIPLKSLLARLDEVEHLCDGRKTVYCICRRGVLSVAATQLLHTESAAHPKIKSVINVKGGLESWRRHVDPSFPTY